MSSESNVKRVTLSLPVGTVKDMDLLAHTLGLSRSAFVSGLLSQILPPMIPLCHAAAKVCSESDSKRYRGDSIAEIDNLVGLLQSGLEELQGDLFKK